LLTAKSGSKNTGKLRPCTGRLCWSARLPVSASVRLSSVYFGKLDTRETNLGIFEK